MIYGLQDFLDLDAGVILWQEKNVDWKKYDLIEDYWSRIKEHWLVNRTKFSASTIPAKDYFLPGGTATTVLGK